MAAKRPELRVAIGGDVYLEGTEWTEGETVEWIRRELGAHPDGTTATLEVRTPGGRWKLRKSFTVDRRQRVTRMRA